VEINIIYKSIDSILQLSRIIENCIINKENEILVNDNFLIIPNDLLKKLDPKQLEIIFLITDLIESDDNFYKIDKGFFFPFKVIISKYKEFVNESTLKYYIKKSIRSFYHCQISSNTITIFNLISYNLNDYLKKSKNKIEVVQIDALYDYCYDNISSNVVNLDKKTLSDLIKCYFETSIFLNYFHVTDYKLSFITHFFDSEFLICNLFGMPTNITGFDVLFGEGGIILPEFVENSTDSIPPRTILISGESGCGKTTLGLQLASEVAQKGGLAWYMPLEQSIEECLYSLKSFQSNSNPQYFIGKNLVEAKIILDKVSKSEESSYFNYGALIFLHPSKENLSDLFNTMISNASSFDDKKLNLFVIDPINSINDQKDNENERSINNSKNLRNQTLDYIKQLESSNKNILIIAENYKNSEGRNFRNLFSFLENICDTHIYLSIRKEYNYWQRYLEIKKSRMQREQRGEHAFSISSENGIHIYPSSASVSARIRIKLFNESLIQNKAEEKASFPISFGQNEVDHILNGALLKKDLIVFEGPAGSFKTTLGVCFLLKGEVEGSKIKSLWFDTNHSNKRRKDDIINEAKNSINADCENIHKDIDIELVTLPSGYINPGYILQIIEETFQDATLEGDTINRVMINGLSHWMLSSPYIANDKIFAIALVQLLRRYDITCLFLTDSINEPNNLLETVADNSNCIFEFARFEFKGYSRVTMKVLRSSGMTHNRNLYEIQKFDNKIIIEPSASLIRFISKEGNIAPIKIRFFFHIDSTIQDEYYKSISKALQAVLSPTADIDVQDRLYFNKAFQMNQFSAMDELQILQIDEFQLAMHNNPKTALSGLYKLPETIIQNSENQDSDYAIPFFENISFLVYRKDKIEDLLNTKDLNDWYKITKAIEAKGCDDVLFDFPKKSTENFNCLYLEILFSLFSKRKKIEKLIEDEKSCTLLSLINSDEGFEAAYLFRKLCKQTYDKSFVRSEGTNQNKNEDVNSIDSPIKVNPDAIIWRHWYTTLNQMLYDYKDLINKIGIVPLPEDISISGKWYLGIPSYSAAPDVGVEIIKQLTSRDSELIRLQKGVGLPTRNSYYTSYNECISRSSEFSLKNFALSKIINNNFKRSTFKCYYHISFGLSSVLKEILVFNSTTIENDKEEIKHLLNNFFIESKYIFQDIEIFNGKIDYNCSSCKKCKKEFNDYFH
jgi:KaiC/GvpD/RAD55 family RecA-like ATPase